jgi:hypothetical protein
LRTKLLNVLCEVENSVTPGDHFGHLQLQRLVFDLIGSSIAIDTSNRCDVGRDIDSR